MRQQPWTCYALLGLVLCNVVLSSPIVKRQINLSQFSRFNPADLNEGLEDNSNEREKRLVDPSPLIETKNNAKNAVLGLVFGKTAAFQKPAPIAQPTTPGGPTTTDDVPVFDRKRVQLVIPDQLFGSSFTLVNSVSKILGDVILGTAQRTQKLIESMKPILGKFVSFKGLGITADATVTNQV